MQKISFVGSITSENIQFFIGVRVLDHYAC